MKDFDMTIKKRTDFFKKIGPGIAVQMSEALQILAHDKIQVEFSGIQTFESQHVLIDIEEKCFGSYVKFSSSRKPVEGIVMSVFPLSSAKSLIELLLKRYHEETEDGRLKLSAFKEGVNILVLTYINGLANALRVRLKMSVPKFVCLRNFEFVSSNLSREDVKESGFVSVGQFSIRSNKTKTGGARLKAGSLSSIEGRFVIVF